MTENNISQFLCINCTAVTVLPFLDGVIVSVSKLNSPDEKTDAVAMSSFKKEQGDQDRFTECQQKQH